LEQLLPPALVKDREKLFSHLSLHFPVKLDRGVPGFLQTVFTLKVDRPSAGWDPTLRLPRSRCVPSAHTGRKSIPTSPGVSPDEVIFSFFAPLPPFSDSCRQTPTSPFWKGTRPHALDSSVNRKRSSLPPLLNLFFSSRLPSIREF